MTSKKRKAMAAGWKDVIFMGKRRNDSSHIYSIFMAKKFMKKYFFLHMGEKNYTNTVLSNPTLETDATVDSSSSASLPNDKRLKFLSKAMIC